jgi:hypothetical protein
MHKISQAPWSEPRSCDWESPVFANYFPVAHRTTGRTCRASLFLEVPMDRRVFLLIGAVSAIALFSTKLQIATAQEGWPPPSPGCHYIGNSACGGDDHGQCAPQERFFSQQCNDGRVINACGVDTHCKSTSRGRFHIGGGWRNGTYQIHQTGDTFTISGGSAGPANGSFVGANTITVTWPQAHATFQGVVSGNGTEANLIRWDHPPNNVWGR